MLLSRLAQTRIALASTRSRNAKRDLIAEVLREDLGESARYVHLAKRAVLRRAKLVSMPERVRQFVRLGRVGAVEDTTAPHVFPDIVASLKHVARGAPVRSRVGRC